MLGFVEVVEVAAVVGVAEVAEPDKVVEVVGIAKVAEVVEVVGTAEFEVAEVGFVETFELEFGHSLRVGDKRMEQTMVQS